MFENYVSIELIILLLENLKKEKTTIYLKYTIL